MRGGDYGSPLSFSVRVLRRYCHGIRELRRRVTALIPILCLRSGWLGGGGVGERGGGAGVTFILMVRRSIVHALCMR